MKKLFVYGTLMNDEVLSSLLTGRFSKTKASLSDYQCVAVLNENYPAIRPEKSSVVNGELIDGLSPEHFLALDQYEGDCYQRIMVTVKTVESKNYQCETYVFKPQYYNLLSNNGWSNSVFRKQYMHAFINNVIR